MDTDICEFLDPISLTPMEEAMVTSCGHSFSKSSILQWLASHPTNARCPVCNATLKPDGLAPNWALRSAIAKFAPRVTSTAGSHLSFDTRGQAEASAPLITVKPCKNEKACTQPTTYRTIQSDDAPPTGSHGCGNCAGEGPQSCCCFDCTHSNLCQVGNACYDEEEGLSVVCFCSQVLCQTTFGRWSNWWTRSICGVMLPLFFVLYLCLSTIDLVLLIVVFFGVGAPLAPLFGLTYLFCPVVNKTADDVCGKQAFLFGNFCSRYAES